VWAQSSEGGVFSALLESLVTAMAPDEEDYRLRQELVARIWECISRSRHCSSKDSLLILARHCSSEDSLSVLALAC